MYKNNQLQQPTSFLFLNEDDLNEEIHFNRDLRKNHQLSELHSSSLVSIPSAQNACQSPSSLNSSTDFYSPIESSLDQNTAISLFAPNANHQIPLDNTFAFFGCDYINNNNTSSSTERNHSSKMSADKISDLSHHTSCIHLSDDPLQFIQNNDPQSFDDTFSADQNVPASSHITIDDHAPFMKDLLFSELPTRKRTMSMYETHALFFEF